MGVLDDVTTNNVGNKPTNNTTETKQKSQFVSDEELEQWLFKANEHFDKKVCMVLGEDGTGKTGLVLNHIANELSKEENKHKYAVVLDLDNGASNLLKHYDEDVQRRILIKDILMVTNTEEGIDLDYEQTMNWIRSVSNYVSRNYEAKNIHAFVFDGLSTLLKHAERQMRLDKNIDVDGGVQLKYWLKRNKDFENTLEIIKKIPVDSYFIGHEDFIITQESASIKIKTNAMMFQKIHCKRIPQDEGVKHTATVMKSKNNPLKENQVYTFMQVKDGNVAFNGEKVFKEL